MSEADFQAYGLNVALHASALAMVAWAAVKCFKNPHARSISALLGLLAVAFLPWLSALQVPARAAVWVKPIEIPSFVPQPSRQISEPVLAAVEKEISPLPAASAKWNFPDPWRIIAGIWVLGCGLMLARQTWIAALSKHWTRTMREPTDNEWQLIEPHFSYRVMIAESETSPFVIGIFRPLLVIPENLLAADRRRELLWALGHEAGHLKGHDLRWFALFQAVRAMFWWNPLIHHLVRIWAEAREQICDHLALAGGGDRREYSSFLVSLVSRRMGGIVMPMAARGTVARLKRRIGFLMEGTVCRPCGRRFIAGGMTLAALVGVGLCQVGCKAASSNHATVGASVGSVISGSLPDQNREAWSTTPRCRTSDFRCFLFILRDPLAQTDRCYRTRPSTNSGNSC